MSKTAVISFRVDEATAALLDNLAEAHGRSRAALVEMLLRREVNREAEFLAFVDEGIADLVAGRTITHDELVAEIRSRRIGSKAA